MYWKRTLFLYKAIEDISISELCDNAGIGRASFYRNFHSKEDILRAYINQLFAERCYDGSYGIKAGSAQSRGICKGVRCLHAVWMGRSMVPERDAGIRGGNETVVSESGAVMGREAFSWEQCFSVAKTTRGERPGHAHIPDLMPRALPFSVSTQLMPTGLRNYKIRAAPLLRAASATACATASLTRGSNATGRI